MWFSKKDFVFRFFLLTSLLYSQERPQISGRVIIDVPDDPKIEISVSNKNTGKSTYTNLYGRFSIAARRGDTLRFSSLTLEKRDLILTEDLLQKNEIIVHLNADYAMLDRVTVYGHRLTGNLKRDAENALSGKKFDQKQIGLPDPKSVSFAWKRKSVLSSLLSFDMQSFYDLSAGKAKQKEELIRYEGQQRLVDTIREYYGEDFFTKTLGMPREKISDFLIFIEETSRLKTLYAEKKFFEIMSLLQEKSRIYLIRLDKYSIF